MHKNIIYHKSACFYNIGKFVICIVTGVVLSLLNQNVSAARLLTSPTSDHLSTTFNFCY